MSAYLVDVIMLGRFIFSRGDGHSPLTERLQSLDQPLTLHMKEEIMYIGERLSLL